jgi:uncharacterized protein (TIGR00288 family)
MSENQKLFVLLIDGDNAQTAFIPHILQKLHEYGELRIAKVFHNKATIEQWEQIASEYSIEPIWVPNNTPHKNSVDIALVMDAMILFYEHMEINGFCIVASDSDYTRLARLLKSRGKFVLGFGAKQTPKPFSNACSTFVHMEELVSSPHSTAQSVNPVEVEPTVSEALSDKAFQKLFVRAYKHLEKTGAIDEETGWVQLREMRETMGSLFPKFQSTDHYQHMRMFVDRVKSLAEAAPRLLEISENLASKPVLHQVRLFGDKELEKFRRAYFYAAEDLNQKDKDGWVALSAIRNTLHAIYSDFQPLIYRSIKYSQLKKVVEQMAMDYPGKIEISQKNLHTQIRMKS